MEENENPLSAAERAKQLGISEEEFRAQAREQIDEFFRKEGVLGPELTPREEEELARQAKADYEAYEKKCPRKPNPLPFPLPDIYDDDDPHLVRAAHGAIRDYRRFRYIPGLGCNIGQLKKATDVALDIRSAWAHEGLELREVPQADSVDNPTEQDFIRFEQWFSDADIAISKEIANGSMPKADTDEPSPADDMPDEKGFVKSPSDESAYRSATRIVADFSTHLPTYKDLTRILATHPKPFIRRWKPTSQRLFVHMGDWQEHVDSTSNVSSDGWSDNLADMEERKEQIRRIKNGK